MRPSWRGRFAAALATLWLGVTVLLVAPARAQDEPAAPPAIESTVRIGPQALVIVDELGNVLMAEEPSPQEEEIPVLDALLAATMGTVVVPLAVLPQFIVTGSDYVEVLDLGSY